MDEGYDKAFDILHETINEIGRQRATNPVLRMRLLYRYHDKQQ
jgi:hypothetical protein